MANEQHYGIKYPFTYDNDDLVYLDLNETYEQSIQAQILHVIFTPKKQKIRDPEFGSDLIKYLYDPSDGTTFENIKSQIRSDIASRVPNVSFDDMEIIDSIDDHTKIVSIHYTVIKGNVETKNNIAIKI
jgi:phage baseplate assembly protein W